MQPRVCAVCITADRAELTRKAVACFEAQTYLAKRLVIYDTSKRGGEVVRYRRHFQQVVIGGSDQTVGELRNEGNAFAGDGEIIVHWDSDEWSHPNRIAEQVALLQSSGADCVGYREMLFSRRMVSRMMCDSFGGEGPDGRIEVDRYEAWLYRNPNPGYTLGTSLCYWRKTWERKPFPAANVGEDLLFCTGLNCVGITSMPVATFDIGKNGDPTNDPKVQPRMIARIHAGNTSTAYEPAKLAKNSEWRRVPEWDAHCRSVMEAA